MASGYIVHYTTPLAPDDLTSGLLTFESAGLVLENPGTGLASLLDNEGNQLRMAAADVRRALVSATIGESITFQFWIPPNNFTDLVSSYIRFNDWLTIRQYWLDGLTPDEREHVINLVCSQIALPSPRTVALVIDRYASADNIEWDAIVQERAKDDRYHADLYLMS